MVATSVFVWGLIWDSVRSPLLATQTASSLTAIPAGSCPTGIVSTTLLVFVSIRLTEPSVGWVTHADPWPTAMDSGLAPRSTEARSDPLSRSMRPTESAPNSSGAGSPPRVSSNGTATAAVTTARATSSATSPRPRSNERGKPARSGAACSGTFGGAYGARRTTASLPFGADADDSDRLGQTFQHEVAPVLEPDPLDPPGEVGDLLAGQDLARSGLAAQPRGQIERPAPIAALHGNGLSGVESDPHHEGQRRVGDGLLDEPVLQLHRRPDGLPGGTENRERLVTAKLDDPAAAPLHAFPRHLGELLGQLGRGLVSALLGEQGVAADVRDEEGPDLGARIG